MSDYEHTAPEDPTLAPLRPDEPAWQVRESDLPVPGLGLRRIQKLFVVRGDAMCEFRKDLGPSWAFPLAKPFCFIAAGCYSVGEALEQAEYLREAQPEPEAPHNLMQQWYQQLDEERQTAARRSVIGPLQRVQRN